LNPCWAPGGFTPDQDDPFVKEKANKKLKVGLYGIHVDSQLEALRKVEEAKEFAKAMKADDTDIPVYLWNDRIRLEGITKERQDAALNGFRKMSHCWFMRGLVRDCMVYMRRMHGPSWGILPWRRDGLLTELGRDWEAISGMLWHATCTSWFDFHVGSRLVHLRFLICVRAMVQDGVPV
jgi:hypothetical protein